MITTSLSVLFFSLLDLKRRVCSYRVLTSISPNFQDGKTYHPLEAYSMSKFANVLFAKSLAKGLADRHITAFSVNPGSK